MKPIFRNSMFGFQKSDVVRFIAKQSSMHEARVTELHEEMEKLRKEHDAEIEELQQDRVALNALQEDNLKKLDAILQIRRLFEELRSEREKLLDASGSCKQSVIEMSDDILSLKAALESAEGYREKAQKFDQLACVLNGIVSGAEAAAPTVITVVENVSLQTDPDKAKEAMEEQEKAVLAVSEKLDLVLQLLESFLQ